MSKSAWMLFVLLALIIRPCLLERLVTYLNQVCNMNGSLQELSRNNNNTIEKLDDNWCRQITDYGERMLDYQCALVIENRRSLIGWMTATGIAN